MESISPVSNEKRPLSRRNEIFDQQSRTNSSAQRTPRAPAVISTHHGIGPSHTNHIDMKQSPPTNNGFSGHYQTDSPVCIPASHTMFQRHGQGQFLESKDNGYCPPSNSYTVSGNYQGDSLPSNISASIPTRRAQMKTRMLSPSRESENRVSPSENCQTACVPRTSALSS